MCYTYIYIYIFCDCCILLWLADSGKVWFWLAASGEVWSQWLAALLEPYLLKSFTWHLCESHDHRTYLCVIYDLNQLALLHIFNLPISILRYNKNQTNCLLYLKYAMIFETDNIIIIIIICWIFTWIESYCLLLYLHDLIIYDDLL